MSFPLLSLPCLVLEEIIKTLNPMEIIFLVQTSQGARHRVLRYTKSHVIELLIADSYVGILCKDQDTFRVKTFTPFSQFNSSWTLQTIIPIQNDSDVSTQKARAFKKVLKILEKTFRIKKVSFETKDDSSFSAVHVLEYCVSKNMKIGRVNWPTFSKNNEMAKRILMASKDASYLNIGGDSPSSMRFDHFHLFRMDFLRIEDAWWLTVENIVDLRNCKRILLGCVRDKLNINKILLEYMKNPGELQEIQMFCFDHITPEEMVKNLKIVRSEKSNVIQKYWFNANNEIPFSAMVLDMETVVIKRET
uniref:F-box domain-containing protein n=1 Tax=Caenorhabditis tropicalis TaxID=1561998 RepID=A0A1I7UT54_9PELO